MTRRAAQQKIPLRGAVSLIVILVLLFWVIASAPAIRPPLASSETQFVEYSRDGLSIIPASCASSASYFHGALSATTDGKGYTTTSGQSEYGANASLAGQYVCVTNSSGLQYFIPSNSAGELSAFKTYVPSGVSVW